MADVFSAIGQLGSALTTLATGAEVVGQRVQSVLADANQRVATQLDDFKFLLQKKMREQHDDVAAAVLSMIQQYEAGAVRADQVARAFQGIKSDVTGQVRDLGAQLQDLLAGAERSGNQLRDRAKTWEEALSRLKQLNTQAAQSVVDMVQRFQQGQLTANFLLKTLDEIRAKAGGREISDLVLMLANEVRRGESGFGPSAGRGGAPGGGGRSGAPRQGSNFTFNLPSGGNGPVILDHMGNPIGVPTPTAIIDPVTGVVSPLGGSVGNFRTGGKAGGSAGGGGSFRLPGAAGDVQRISEDLDRRGVANVGPEVAAAAVAKTFERGGPLDAAVNAFEERLDAMLQKVAAATGPAGSGSWDGGRAQRLADASYTGLFG